MTRTFAADARRQSRASLVLLAGGLALAAAAVLGYGGLIVADATGASIALLGGLAALALGYGSWRSVREHRLVRSFVPDGEPVKVSALGYGLDDGRVVGALAFTTSRVHCITVRGTERVHEAYRYSSVEDVYELADGSLVIEGRFPHGGWRLPSLRDDVRASVKAAALNKPAL